MQQLQNYRLYHNMKVSINLYIFIHLEKRIALPIFVLKKRERININIFDSRSRLLINKKVV